MSKYPQPPVQQPPTERRGQNDHEYPTPYRPQGVRPEKSIWVGVGATALLAIAVPLQILVAFGLLGFLILLIALRSFSDAFQFDLFFVLWSVLYIAPAAIAYIFGGLLRMAARLPQTDSWSTATGIFTAIGVAGIGFDMFTDALGWNTTSYVVGWIALLAVVAVYMTAFVAGWTGALRGE